MIAEKFKHIMKRDYPDIYYAIFVPTTESIENRRSIHIENLEELLKTIKYAETREHLESLCVNSIIRVLFLEYLRDNQELIRLKLL